MKHCNGCQRCVPGFDHHCPWIDSCVTKSNRRLFSLFLLSSFIGLLYVVRDLMNGISFDLDTLISFKVFCSFNFASIYLRFLSNIFSSYKVAPRITLIVVYSCVLLIWVLVLLVVQLFLIVTGNTTYRLFRQKRKKSSTGFINGISLEKIRSNFLTFLKGRDLE